MNKLFKPRCMRRIILFFALAFPMVYLMGTAFFSLNGSHGNVLLAQEEEVVTSSQLVDFNQMIQNGNFQNSDYWSIHGGTGAVSSNTMRITSNSASPNLTLNPAYTMSFVSGHQYLQLASVKILSATNTPTRLLGMDNGSYAVAFGDVNNPVVGTTYNFGKISNTPSSASYVYLQCSKANASDVVVLNVQNVQVFDLTQMYGAGNEPTLEDFRSRYNASYYDYTLSTKIVEQTTETPTYSEYLFNQVFGHDNIVTQLGYYALSEEQKGFVPVSSLIRFVDSNILKWGTDNSVALFTYGYLYYAMNVIIVYEISVIAIKLLLLPLKAIDVFDKGEDKHD